jgi:uncharacterized membrane protein YcaP (DUF421 family)
MDIALRAIVLFFFVYLITRVIGRRELSQLAPFDLILLIVLGDAIQQGLTQDDYSVTGAVIAISTMASLQVMLSLLSFRFRPLRAVLDGEPIVIVQDGQPIERNLRRDRLALEEVMEEARLQQGISSVDEIAWAVLEPSGNISFIKKADSS